MTYNQTLDYIHSLGNFSMSAGLCRIKEVLQRLGNPQDKFKSIHIAGTNGKGSVSAMLSNIFTRAEFKTGLFISPFIIDFRERIQINNEYISERDLVEFSNRVIKTNIKLTEFEFITAVAFLYFAEQNCDIAIIETGLGGRLDATNTLSSPLVSVITKIGLDHTAILGNTVSEIAEEKCGIIKNCPTVTSANQQKEALDIIIENSKSLFIPDKEKLKIINNQEFGNTFIYKGYEYKLSLCGDYQIENALIVLDTVHASGYDIPYNIIYEALKETRFPARMEIVSRKPLIIIDGAHNPDGAFVLARELKKYQGKVTAIIGMMKDKNYNEFLKNTLCYCKAAVVVEVKNIPRSLKAEELQKSASLFCECYKSDDYDEAIKTAKLVSNGEPIFIFGSLYLASQIRKHFIL